MRIVYSPNYSGSHYIDLKKRKDSLLGLKVCGSLELLSELELRAGIVSQELSEPERLVDFHKALSEHIAHTIFEPSFKNDEIGVSRQLMSWSDNLLMEGWTPESDIDSPKLKDLAKIVKGVNNKHISARWKDLAAYVSSHPILHTDDSIEVHDKDQVPAVIKMALEELAKQKVLIAWSAVFVIYGFIFCYLPLYMPTLLICRLLPFRILLPACRPAALRTLSISYGMIGLNLNRIIA